MACVTVPAQDIGQRLEILLGIYFCVIALKFSVAEKLPKLPYNTVADWYILVVFLLIFVVVVETAVVGVIYQRQLCSDFDDGCLVTHYIDDCFLVIHGAVDALYHGYLLCKFYRCRRVCRIWLQSALESLSVPDIFA